MMIARASRVLPGLLVSICLAGPAFAAAPTDTPDAKRVGQTESHKHAAGKTVAHTPHAAKHLAAAKPAGAKPSGAKQAAAPSVAFVDDNFSYTESPTGKPGWKQTGVASWYGGKRWQGHLTSSGARYDENQLTAAHATLPLGSYVKVKLHNSERYVIVLITDRPGTRTRIIDLSRAAARELGILAQGVAMVTLSPL